MKWLRIISYTINIWLFMRLNYWIISLKIKFVKCTSQWSNCILINIPTDWIWNLFHGFIKYSRQTLNECHIALKSIDIFIRSMNIFFLHHMKMWHVCREIINVWISLANEIIKLNELCDFFLHCVIYSIYGHWITIVRIHCYWMQHKCSSCDLSLGNV